jgi:hypothetical protein
MHDGLAGTLFIPMWSKERTHDPGLGGLLLSP